VLNGEEYSAAETPRNSIRPTTNLKKQAYFEVSDFDCLDIRINFNVLQYNLTLIPLLFMQVYS